MSFCKLNIVNTAPQEAHKQKIFPVFAGKDSGREVNPVSQRFFIKKMEEFCTKNYRFPKKWCIIST